MTTFNADITLDGTALPISIQNPTPELLDQLNHHPLQITSIGATYAITSPDTLDEWDTSPHWEIPVTFTCGNATHTETHETYSPLEVAVIESITPETPITLTAETSPGLYGKTWIDLTIRLIDTLQFTAIDDTFVLPNGEETGAGKGVNLI